jgi:hypothetical protein
MVQAPILYIYSEQRKPWMEMDLCKRAASSEMAQETAEAARLAWSLKTCPAGQSMNHCETKAREVTALAYID